MSCSNSKADDPAALRAMHSYPEITQQVGQKELLTFETVYILDSIKSVRQFTTDTPWIDLDFSL
jgi:hypothetical protein